jgi:hypothetical protein
VEGQFIRGRRAVVIMRTFDEAQTFPCGRPSFRVVWPGARRQYALEIVIGDRRRRREYTLWGADLHGGAVITRGSEVFRAWEGEGTVTKQQEGA